jgi:hypothetical protein
MQKTVGLFLVLGASASAYVTGYVTPGAMPLSGARSAQAALYSLYKLQIDEDAEEKQFNWKVQRDHEERSHSISSIKESIEDRKPDFDVYIDPQKKKADVIIKVLSTALGKDDQKYLKVEMIQIKDVKNFKPTYIMDVESKITIKPVDVDTGDALQNKLSTTLKPLVLADAPGVTQDDWSIKWVDVVLTVLPLVCELYVVVSIFCWRRSSPREWMLNRTLTVEDHSSTFCRGSDGNCTICGKTEGNHINGNDKYCVRTFRRGADGNCTICSKTEGNHYSHPNPQCDQQCWSKFDGSGYSGKCTICRRTEGNHFVDSNGDKYCRDRGWNSWNYYPCDSYFMVCSMLSFPVSVGTSIGKLYPPSTGYIGCSSVRCVKVVHNAVMTLVCFPFDLTDAVNLHRKAQADPVRTRPYLCAKITQVVLSSGYLLYDTFRQNAPGPGTTGLVVVACLSDLLLLGCESYALYTTGKQRREDPETLEEMEEDPIVRRIGTA